MEGFYNNSHLIIFFFFFLFLHLCLGCRRIPHPSGSGIDMCHFDIDGEYKRSDKNGAISDNVVGGTIIGATGTVCATQVGMFCVCIYLCMYVCVYLCMYVYIYILHLIEKVNVKINFEIFSFYIYYFVIRWNFFN
jgi:hypothetical protein